MADILPLPTQSTGLGMMAPQGGAATAGLPQITDQHQKLLRWVSAVNIATELDESELSKIGTRVKEEYDIDKTSRGDWEDKTKQAVDLAMQVAKEKQYPWPKAANVIYPLMTTASIQFAARAYPAIVSGKEVVKGAVVGPDNGTPKMGPDGTPVIQIDHRTGQMGPVWDIPPGAKKSRAERIGDHMSWQCLDEMPEWEGETDQLLHILPIVGMVPRKSYYDPEKRRNVSVIVHPLAFVVNYKAKSLETAPRITEEIQYYPREITELERAGIFIPHDYGIAQDKADQSDVDSPHVFLEQHRYWDLDDDGYSEPYIVTVHKETGMVARIVARFDADGIVINRQNGEIQKIEPIHYYTLYIFIPNTESAIYGMGFGQLLKPINEAVNTTLNMLLDAGHLANTGGGFIGKGLSMNAGTIRFTPGEYKPVNVPGGIVRDSIVPLPFPGPSPVLFNLLGMLIEAGKEIASVKDVLTGDTKAQTMQPTTLLALIEQGLKVFTSIWKRVHRSLKKELDKLYRLNRIYIENGQYKVGEEWRVITKDDYANGSGVEPVSDPSMVTDMQRLTRAQFLMGFANDPYFNPLEIRQRVLDAAEIPDAEKLLVPQPPPNPAIAIKGMELDIKNKHATGDLLMKLSGAILNLAKADKAVGDAHIAWLDQQLKAIQASFEGQDGSGQPGQGAGNGQGNNPSPVQRMATPPHIENPVPVFSGQAGVPPASSAGPMA